EGGTIVAGNVVSRGRGAVGGPFFPGGRSRERSVGALNLRTGRIETYQGPFTFISAFGRSPTIIWAGPSGTPMRCWRGKTMCCGRRWNDDAGPTEAEMVGRRGCVAARGGGAGERNGGGGGAAEGGTGEGGCDEGAQGSGAAQRGGQEALQRGKVRR